jgi:RHS repeat-associated protein
MTRRLRGGERIDVFRQDWLDGEKHMIGYGYNNDDLRTAFTNAPRTCGRRVKIVEKNNGTITSTKQFVWCGKQICEERDGNNSVTARFYGEGFIRYVPSAQPLFYTRDHLGSVREVTDSTGAVRARYDYDPYGRVMKVSGDLDSDFRYTGHYFHAPSGLHLAMYRAYDADLGSWLNRDPIGEEGGLNLYGYVANDPINDHDPWGLKWMKFYNKNAGKPIFGSDEPQPLFLTIWVDDGSIFNRNYKTDYERAVELSGDNSLDVVAGSIGPARGLGSYIIKCKDGMYYVGKGPFGRMLKSITNLFKKGKTPVKAVHESSQPQTTAKALKDEAQKMRDLGGLDGGKLLNKINSPGEKLLPPE